MIVGLFVVGLRNNKLFLLWLFFVSFKLGLADYCHLFPKHILESVARPTLRPQLGLLPQQQLRMVNHY